MRLDCCPLQVHRHAHCGLQTATKTSSAGRSRWTPSLAPRGFKLPPVHAAAADHLKGVGRRAEWPGGEGSRSASALAACARSPPSRCTREAPAAGPAAAPPSGWRPQWCHPNHSCWTRSPSSQRGAPQAAVSAAGVSRDEDHFRNGEQATGQISRGVTSETRRLGGPPLFSSGVAFPRD